MVTASNKKKKNKACLEYCSSRKKQRHHVCCTLQAETCTCEWGLSLLTSKWRFEWLCRDAFLSRVCCRRRLVNRSGDVCDRDRWLSRKTNTHCYNIVENWIRLLLSAFPLPPLMVPVCLPCMAKCWLLYINVSPSPLLPQTKVTHASSSTCLLHTWTFTAPVTGQESTGFVKHWC